MKKILILAGCVCGTIFWASAQQVASSKCTLKGCCTDNEYYMDQAIELSKQSVVTGGGPFGAVVVKDGKVIAAASNSVTQTNDPTAHAEINAIRKACSTLKTFSLKGCELYTSCEPCPMCLSAAYWANIKKIYFGNTRADAKKINFDDSFIYDEIPLDVKKRRIPSERVGGDKAIEAFKMWTAKSDKIEY
ncbi:MAG: nucleoside deaminase [Alistipes sp.]